jgi:integrase
MISAFLDHLQADRHNSARSRNTRLAALRSLFGYAALRHPEHAELIRQVLGMPSKRFDKTMVPFLNPEEGRALLSAPDLDCWASRRDRALTALAVQTGLRLAELTGLNCGDIELRAFRPRQRRHERENRVHKPPPTTAGGLSGLSRGRD